MKTAQQIRREDAIATWRPRRVRSTKEISERQYLDIEPAIRDVVRSLNTLGFRTAFSCGGHYKGGKPVVYYSLGPDADKLAAGRPYVIVALDGKNEGQHRRCAMEAFFELAMQGRGPMLCFVADGLEKNNPTMRKAFPRDHTFLCIVFQNRRAAKSRWVR